jgi:hypothetical protein
MREGFKIIDRRLAMPNLPPPITEPMGRNWNQPPITAIEIDDTHALMSRRTFDQLAEYSASLPTGVYSGKMWKRHDGVFDAGFIHSGGKPEWLLCWYGESGKGPDWCSNNYRKIILSDGEFPK